MPELLNEYKDIGGIDGVFYPLYVDATGQYRRIPSGSILDIAGIYSTNFTVGGKAIMFADGTSSTGQPAVNLQLVYDYTTAENGAAKIKLTPGKDFAICNAAGDPFIEVDAETGKVTINGEMSVISSIVKFLGSYQEFDHINILSNTGTKTALLIEPKPGVNFVTDPVRIKASSTGPIDFSINTQGQTYIRDLIVDNIDVNLIDGIDFEGIKSHLSTIEIPYKHYATEIKYVPTVSTQLIPTDGISSVAGALDTLFDAVSVNFDTINTRLNTLTELVNALIQGEAGEADFFQRIIQLETTVAGIDTRVTNAENSIQHLESIISNIQTASVVGIDFKQLVEAEVWTIQHNSNSTLVQFTVYDQSDRLMWPDDAFALNSNTFVIVFGSPQNGRAVLSCLVPPVIEIQGQ